MNKAVISVILGIISLTLGPFALIPSAIGLFLGIKALKIPASSISIPVGYKGKVGEKEVSAQPFVSSKLFVWVGLVLNAIALFFAVIAVVAFIAVGSGFFFLQRFIK